MRHSAITRPIVKELNPIKLDAQGPHLAVPGEGKLAHGIELRPLLAVDGDADSLAGYRAHDKVPARYGLQDTFTGVVGLDYFAIVEEDAQGSQIGRSHESYIYHTPLEYEHQGQSRTDPDAPLPAESGWLFLPVRTLQLHPVWRDQHG